MLKSYKIINSLNGEVLIPGDKSISHRSIIIPSISNGITEVSNLLMSEDVENTINAFKEMGVDIKKNRNNITIDGKGLNSLKKPVNVIYLGNSGTSARLLTGLLSSQNFSSCLTGDKSLSSRPMKRIIDPLMKMGADIKSDNGMLPIYINGKKLNNIKHEITIPSAQIKSGLIFASLNTEGQTTIKENNITRDHTEIMLKSFGADIDIKKNEHSKIITINGNQEMKSKNISVPSDLSSASFFIVAALINDNSNIKIKNININPTRDGIIKALKIMGAKIQITNKKILNEEVVADLEILSSNLSGCELNEDMSKLMIDEFPILSIAASFASSPSIFRGLSELKVKESDRLELIRYNLVNCGVNCKVEGDDLFIFPKKNYIVKNKNIRTDYDHRIAMAFSVMGSKLNNNLIIEDSNSIDTSFPNFIEKYNKVGGNLVE
jgi:3-phosphoshikimate 1-carboxyvinyltransferase